MDHTEQMSQEEGFEGCCGVTSARDGPRNVTTALKTRLAETAGEITVLVTGARVLRIIDVPDLRY